MDPLSYGNDRNGERVSAASANGSRTLYSYGAASELTSVVSTSGPTLTALSARTGSSAGGTVVTVTGRGFLPGAAVWFGNRAASVVTSSATTITVKTPAGSGTVPVTVTTDIGRSATVAAGTFTYQGPTVTGPALRTGPSSGGQSITITGWNLSGAKAVAFGSKSARFTVTSPEKISATVPAGSGAQHIRVTTQQGTSATTSADTYTYVARLWSRACPRRLGRRRRS